MDAFDFGFISICIILIHNIKTHKRKIKRFLANVNCKLIFEYSTHLSKRRDLIYSLVILRSKYNVLK